MKNFGSVVMMNMAEMCMCSMRRFCHTHFSADGFFTESVNAD